MRAAMCSIFTSVQYYSIPERTLKPFNPLLGETYEYSCKDFKFLAEQVSHHPPITANHAYGRGYEAWTHTEMKSKFWGKSLEFTPLGKAYFVIGDEHYICTRPKTIANNIIIGTLYLDLGGTTICVCPQTGVKCEINHIEKSMFSRKSYVIEGTVYDESGKKTLTIEGQWNESVTITDLSTKEKTLVWEKPTSPDNHNDQFGFTKFAINLNNLTPEIEDKIAPTDSRYRPDLRAFEACDIEEGSKQKHRLEEKQREIRKLRKDQEVTWEPLWFEEVIDDDTGDRFFKINNKYWLQREKKDWSACPDIFSENPVEL
jgi:hypothetical protein